MVVDESGFSMVVDESGFSMVVDESGFSMDHKPGETIRLSWLSWHVCMLVGM